MSDISLSFKKSAAYREASYFASGVAFDDIHRNYDITHVNNRVWVLTISPDPRLENPYFMKAYPDANVLRVYVPDVNLAIRFAWCTHNNYEDNAHLYGCSK